MSEINKSMDVAELNIQPPIVGKTRLTDDMQQTLALLTAMGADRRRPIRCSESGVLNVVNPRIRDIEGYSRTADGINAIGTDTPCTECMMLGHPSNTGTVWVRPNKIATANNAWPLLKGEVVGFVLDNLSQLHIFFETAGDRLIVAHTR